MVFIVIKGAAGKEFLIFLEFFLYRIGRNGKTGFDVVDQTLPVARLLVEFAQGVEDGAHGFEKNGRIVS